MDKEIIKRSAVVDMRKTLDVGEWLLHEKVALTCRILFDAGHDAGLSGQITARETANTFITQRLGFGFDEISAANLLTVDENIQVLKGDGMPNPANRFHSWIYRARPDVNCIVHTHPLHASTLSMIEQPLMISHMDNCVLYGNVAFMPKWPGIPVGNDEGELISQALGDKKALLLGHHGLVVAASNVEEACVVALQFERAAKMQLLALAAGDISPIDPMLAEEAREWLSQPIRISATFSYYARRALRRDRSCLN